ncbi:MAG: hypothetical protein CMP21_08700 [Rickettsiales bacterium]|nr:hypothetical protein [Rickettsiales bacterium]|tara:strand:+ start:6109 stop:6657 length:549 start_codon:yes stop_codon:yes gene_type:complete
MRNLNNFRLLQINIDIDCFKSEIKNNQSLWDSNVLRQTTLNTQKMTKAIPLFVAKPPFYFFLKQGFKSSASRYFPNTVKWLLDFAKKQNGKLSKAAIVLLKPNGQVLRHIDHHSFYKTRDRYHLGLQTNPNCLLKCGDEEISIKEGELWAFNNKEYHEAFNNSKADRIHIIFDIYKPQELFW